MKSAHQNQPPIADRYDVLIAGARVAGASTAMLLARMGLRVLVVDPLPKGRDTLSTHALMRGGVLQLHRWGLLDALRERGTPPIRHTTFDYGDERITIPIKSRDGIDALYAPRRTVLDPLLADAAADAGAQFAYGFSLTRLLRDASGRVRGAWIASRDGAHRVQADVVIGADGIRSKVARLVNAEVVHSARHTTASIYGHFDGLDTNGYTWSFREGSSMGVIPTNAGRACVFASVRPELFNRVRADGLDACFYETVKNIDPELGATLLAGRSSVQLRAFAGVPGFLLRSAGPGWALVGDAGYFKDPLTAHGMTDALRDAELLARAVVAGGDEALVEYQEIRDKVGHGLMQVTDEIASLEWDMDEVREMHKRLAREMNVGVELIRGLSDDGIAGRAVDGVAPHRKHA